ncbi:DNA recombination protein RmuC [Methylocaldum szegediense]|uniref:DNA recombination protein RmuC homolog n=1 Tax=Methylocaldum szegediense TaxID=73780 RepID=A0ABN8X1D8_9GAMM|nr:DNA recombination protein RmuC [Methylocaldum szegediense]CAI8803838.1 DNA recombination protein RmuC homolog [Methylocaldum szegediense]
MEKAIWVADFDKLSPSIALAAGLAIGLAVGWLVSALRHRGHHPELCRRSAEQQAERIAQLSEELAAGQAQVFSLNAKLAVADEKAARIPLLESEIKSHLQTVAEMHRDLQEQIARRTAFEQQTARVPVLEAELAERNEQLQSLRTEVAELKTRLENERQNTEEKLALLRNAEVQLFAQFETLAQKILEEKTRKFTEQNKNQLDGLLSPFREQLQDFRKKVDEMHLHDAKDRASLRQELESLRQQTQRINQEAVNLTRALKGDKKLQGAWGELILERVLEQSGLRKGIEYETQGGYRDGDNRLFRPDVIVHLPEGKDIIIDSKVSLVAYERCCALDDGPERELAVREHVQAVRNHIKTLAQKDYSSLIGLRSLDFILLFMPIESAFMLAFQHDDKLFSDAFASNIVVVTPTTLLATLRTIENIWRYERRNENAKLIADKAGAIYDKLRGFVEDLEKLGTQLGNAHKAYEDAMNKLTRGRGNLIRQAESFVELGAKVNKRLPKSILERIDLEAEDDTYTALSLELQTVGEARDSSKG